MRRIAIAIIWMGVAVAPARADVFRLRNGGVIEGELQAAAGSRSHYRVRTAQGAILTLAKSQVAKVERQSAADREYRQRSTAAADTVEAQWELAEWCRKHHFESQRDGHLARIIELDPNHVAARRGLGYSQIDGRWVTREQHMTEQGYVRQGGRWMLPQEIEQKEQDRKDNLARKQWFTTIKRWREALDSERAEEAKSHLRAINDPYAVDALKKNLQSEANAQVRIWYLESLSRINTAAATETLVKASILDPVDEVRLTAVDHLADHPTPAAIAMYIKGLGDNDNAVVNRSALGLGRLKDPSAIGPLIEALHTTHKFTVTQGQQGMSSTFGGGGGAGGGGISMGQSVTQIERQYSNPEALDALIRLTGQNFDYDQGAWKAWFAAQKKPQSLDVRRD